LWGECLKKIGHCFLCIDAREGPYGDQWNTRVLIKGEARLLVRRAYGRASDRRDQR